MIELVADTRGPAANRRVVMSAKRAVEAPSLRPVMPIRLGSAIPRATIMFTPVTTDDSRLLRSAPSFFVTSPLR